MGFFQSYPDHSRNVPGFTRTFLLAPKITYLTYKIFRPLHHPPLKISLVPETKTKHTTQQDHRREVGMLKSQNLDPRRSSPRTCNRERRPTALSKLFYPPLRTTLNLHTSSTYQTHLNTHQHTSDTSQHTSFRSSAHTHPSKHSEHI